METGAEPVSTKTHVEDGLAGVILEKSLIEVDKKNLSTSLDDEITTQVAEVVNGSGNKEDESGEAKKTVTVAKDSKTSEKDKDEPESINTNKDVKILSSDVSLEKEKEESITREPEKASKEILIKTDEVRDEKDSRTVETSVNGTESTVSGQEISRNIENQTVSEEETARDGESLNVFATTKSDEIEEDKEEMKIDAEPSLNVIEKVETETVKTATEDPKIIHNEETTVHESESLKTHEEPEEAEPSLNVIEKVEVEAENVKTAIKDPKMVNNEETTVYESESLKTHEEPEDAEPCLNVIDKVETETVKTVIEDPKVVNNEETTVHESDSLKVSVEPEEAIRNSNDAEQISSVVIADREKEEVQDSPSVVETPTIQGEDIESKVSIEHKEEVEQCSKDIEKHEQCDILEAEAVDTSTAKDATLLKSSETNINETETVHNAMGGEEEETDMVKTVISSDEFDSYNHHRVSSSGVQAEVMGEHNETCSSAIKDESNEVKSEETVRNESTEEKHENILDVGSTESEKYQDNEPETALVANTESPDRFEEVPSDLVLKVDKEELKDEKTKVDHVDETQTVEEQRDQNSNEPEAEKADRNRTDETEEIPTEITVGQVEQTRDIEPSLILSEEQVKEACFRDDQQKEETETNGESLHNVETTTRVLEVAKQEETEIISNEETTAHDSESLKEDDPRGKNVESVEASEVTGEREKEENITQNPEEMKESPSVIETLTIQGEDIESKASLAVKEESDQNSKNTEEHEHELGRDITQCETLKADAVDISTVHEAAILKNMETEVKETSVELNEEDAQKEAEMVTSVTFSDKERPSDQVDAQAEELGEHTGPCSSEIIDESKGREEFVEVKSKETVQEERIEGKDVNQLDLQTGESEKYQDNKPEISQVSKTETREEIPSDFALDGTQTIEEPRGLDLNDSETERIEQNIAGKTEESPAEKLVAVEGVRLDETTQNQTFVDVESIEKMQTSPLESPELSKEDVKVYQEGQEEGSNGLDTKGEVASVSDSSELEAKAPEEESFLPNEEEKETKLQKEEIEKHEPTKEEKSDEFIQISSASPSEDLEGETVVEAAAAKIEDTKENEAEEEVTDKIKRSLESVEIVEPHSSLPSSSEEQYHGTDVKANNIKDIKENEEEEEEVTDKIERSLESVEIVEPHSSLPSSSEEQPHVTVAEANMTEDEKLTGGMSEKDLEITETTHLSLAPPLDEQEKVTPTEKGETEEKESQDDIVDSSTSPMLSEKNDNETLTAEVEKVDEEITGVDIAGISKTSRDLYHEDSEKLEAPKLEELKEDKSQDISDTNQTLSSEKSPSSEIVSELDDQIPREVEGIHEEETKETHSSEVEVEEIHEEETKEAHKLHEGEIIPTEAVPNLEVSKQETSQKTTKTIEATEASGDQIPKEVEEIHEDETMEAQKLQDEEIIPTEVVPNLEVSKQERNQESTETTEATKTSGDETPKQVEEIHEEETMEVQKLQEEEILPSKTVPKESFDDAPVSILASGEHETVTLKEGNCASEVRDTDETQEERSVSADTEERAAESKQTESEAEGTEKSEDQVETSSYPLFLEKAIAVPTVEEPEAPKVEESKELKIREIQEISEAIEARGDQTLTIETSQEDQTLSSELVSRLDDQTLRQAEEIHEKETKDQTLSSDLASGLDDQTPKQVEEIHGEEKKEAHKSQVASAQSILAETSQADQTASLVSERENQTPKNVNEIHEEETEEAHILQVETDQVIPVETSHEYQTPSLVSEQDDQTPKKVEKIHEEETKEAQNFQDATDQALPVEPSLEDQTPSLVSEQDGQTPKQVEKIHEEETKEAQNYQDATDQALPVETFHADQTSFLVSEQDDQTPKQAEKIHEEETKEAHKLQAEEILPTETVPTESFSEPPVSMLASREDEPVTLQEGQLAGDTQEERHVSAETEPKESDEQVETSTNLTKVEDENTEKTDIEVAELTNGQSMPNAPDNACLKQEELKETGTLLNDTITEDQSPLRNDNPTGEAEHGDETTSNLPVVEILKGLQTTLETERESNESESLAENIVTEQAEIVQKTGDAKAESDEVDSAPEIVETGKIQEERSLVEKSLPIEELNLHEEDKEEVKVLDDISREFEVSVEKKLQEEEIREIAEKQEESKAQQDVNASTAEKISLQEEQHPRDFEISKEVEDNSDQVMDLPEDQTQTEQNPEIHETVKEEDQIVDLKEVQDEKFEGLSATRDIGDKNSLEVKKDQEDASDLGVGHGFASPQVEKEEEPHRLLGNDVEIKEVVTSEKQIIDPVVIIEKSEHESNEEHVEPQAIPDDAKTHSDRDFPTEQAPKEQREEVNADSSLTKEAFNEQIQVPSSALQDNQDQSHTHVEETSFKAPEKDKETAEQQKKSNDLTDVQEDIGKNVELEVRDDEIRGDGYDSVVALKKEDTLIEEKREIELEDAIKQGVSVKENNVSEKIDGREIFQEECKQTETVTPIKEEGLSGESKEMPAEKKTEETMFLQKETAQECRKNTDDAIHKTQPEIRETESLSSVSKTHDMSKQEEEVPKPENLKNAEELQQKDEESEPTVKEPARKSLSDLIQKVKPTNETEEATREPHVEEEPKTEEEEEEHKEDKTSPDSMVMVEAKDTVSIVKTQKKSHGILSGVGSKVKHSISKVKKVFTGKSSHTSKPSSPE